MSVLYIEISPQAVIGNQESIVFFKLCYNYTVINILTHNTFKHITKSQQQTIKQHSTTYTTCYSLDDLIRKLGLVFKVKVT